MGRKSACCCLSQRFIYERHGGSEWNRLISLSSQTNETLKEIYDLLFRKLKGAGYAPKRQNVALNISVRDYSVILCRQSARTRLRLTTASIAIKPTLG